MASEDDLGQSFEDIENLLDYKIEISVTVSCSRPRIDPSDNSMNIDRNEDVQEQGPVPTLEELDCHFVLSIIGSDPEESKQLSFLRISETDADAEAKSGSASRPGTAKQSIASSRPSSHISRPTADGSNGHAGVEESHADLDEAWSHTFSVQLAVSEDAVLRLCRNTESSLSLVKAGLDVPLLLLPLDLAPLVAGDRMLEVLDHAGSSQTQHRLRSVTPVISSKRSGYPHDRGSLDKREQTH